MKRNSIGFSKLLLVGAAAFATVVSVPRAQATLGEPVESVEKVREKIGGAQKKAVEQGAYSVHEISSHTLTIREYVSSSTGIVFGLYWSGLHQPDLSVLLGSYWNDYHNSLSKSKKVLGRRRQSAVGEHVVVSKWGHMRKLQGKAYDPNLLPDGISADEIK